MRQPDRRRFSPAEKKIWANAERDFVGVDSSMCVPSSIDI
jgi:hypothetical protein